MAGGILLAWLFCIDLLARRWQWFSVGHRVPVIYKAGCVRYGFISFAEVALQSFQMCEENVFARKIWPSVVYVSKLLHVPHILVWM